MFSRLVNWTNGTKSRKTSQFENLFKNSTVGLLSRSIFSFTWVSTSMKLSDLVKWHQTKSLFKADVKLNSRFHAIGLFLYTSWKHNRKTDFVIFPRGYRNKPMGAWNELRNTVPSLTFFIETATRGVLLKKLLLKNSQISQENLSPRASFLMNF